MPDKLGLQELCSTLEQQLPKTNSEIFSGFNVPEDYPWREKMTDKTNMYACLYGLAQAYIPRSILEVGTGWGLSLMTWLKFREDRLGYVCSLDRGGFEKEKHRLDNLRLVKEVIGHQSTFASVRRVDTQLLYSERSYSGYGWASLPGGSVYDVLFIDGDHGSEERPWALFSDLWQFWPFLSHGGLCICDDMHDPADYEPGRFLWLGYSWKSFHTFRDMLSDQIEDSYIWKHPYVPSGNRPVGLLVKR